MSFRVELSGPGIVRIGEHHYTHAQKDSLKISQHQLPFLHIPISLELTMGVLMVLGLCRSSGSQGLGLIRLGGNKGFFRGFEVGRIRVPFSPFRALGLAENLGCLGF